MATDLSKVVCLACQQVNFIRDGPIFPCVSCGRSLQRARCPHCQTAQYWSGNFPNQDGRLIRCSTCSKDFRFFNCSPCRAAVYFKPFDFKDAMMKSCPQCKFLIACACCPACSDDLADPSAGSIHKGLLQCASCHHRHQILRCPRCSTTQLEKSSGLNTLRTSYCDSCKGNFAYLRCVHCQHTNLWPTAHVDLSKYQCFSCQKDLRTSVAAPPRRGRSSSFEGVRGSPRVGRPTGRKMCSYFAECLEFVKQLRWPRNVFNAEFNKCYCRQCYSDVQPSVLTVSGSSYVVPRQWVGFGLGVDPFLVDDPWKTYVIVYHGTTSIAAKSILHHRQFLLPGDVLLDGSRLGIRPGHIPGKKHIYTSPSINYASLEAYSERYAFQSPKSGNLYRAQIVLQARQKPGTFQIQRETVGWGTRPICPFFSNEHIEYFTERRSSVVPYRLLVRLESVT